MRNFCQKMVAIVLSVMLLTAMLPSNLIAFAAVDTGVTITAATVTAMPGESVALELTIENNPGILGATLSVSYDPALSLTGVENGEAFASLAMTPPGRLTVNPAVFTWDSLDEPASADGTILTLTFSVPDDAATDTEYAVSLSYDDGDIVDADLDAVRVKLVNGAVNVQDFMYGDVDSNKKVNSTDVIRIRRHIATGWEQTINEKAADVDLNNKINSTDVIYVRRYIATGWDITLPVLAKCTHAALEHHPYVAPTTTAEGYEEHWYCPTCKKFFSDEGAKNETALSDIVIEKTGNPDKEHSITYDIANGDPYLISLLNNNQINNSNRSSYYEGETVTLRNLSVDGYRFLGWFDGAGSNADQIRKIDSSMNDDVELFAHWEKIQYTVQFKSSLFLNENEITYTVDKGVVLPTPKLSNYVFVGWTDENGHLYNNTKIPAGTTDNIILTANWTSERNKAWTKTKLDAPVIFEDEDNNTILFIYEIGKIQNVPLYVVNDFGYIAGDGITKTETKSYSVTTEQSLMESFANTLTNATTKTTNWTLSEDWNESIELNKEWYEERGLTQAEGEKIAKSESGNWIVSSGSNGSSETTHLNTNQNNWENEVKTSSSSEQTDSAHIGGEFSASTSASALGMKAEMGFKMELDSDTSKTSKKGVEFGGTTGNTNITTDTAKSTSGWNTSSSRGGSNTTSNSLETSSEIAEKISNSMNFNTSYIHGGNSSQSEGVTSTNQATTEYGSTVTYSKVTTDEVTRTWTTQSTKPGYHRWIVAGTAHVFGIVGYDMSSQSYFVNTYAIMDDETHEFEDYSYSSANYDDEENGVISFDIPYEVVDYVTEKTAFTKGLKVDQQTGLVTGYTGTDTCVIIPEYMNVGDGDVVKITGIKEGAFENKTNITVVILSENITEIPKDAFKGCSSLVGVTGASIKEIGDNAFSGCTSIVDCVVSSEVTSLGQNAFTGVNNVFINARNASVAEAAVGCGAKKITLNLEDGANGLNGKSFTVPNNTEEFVFNGNNQTFNGFSLISEADKTIINKASFVGNSSIPLQITSPEVVLNQVSVSSSGLGLVLKADQTHLGLQGTVEISSSNAISMLSKNLNVYESNQNVNGRLSGNGKLIVCGTIEGKSLVTKVNETVSYTDFDNYLKSHKVAFNANGGTTLTAEKSVNFNEPYGTLPTPTYDGHTFAGWYTAASNGTKITADSIVTSTANETLYAHWDVNDYQITLNNQSATSPGTTSVTATYGNAMPSITQPTKTGYTFNGYYKNTNGGGTKYYNANGSSARTCDLTSNTTLYAYWTANTYSVTFNGNGGSSGGTKPVTYGSTYGTLPTVTRDYYSFDGWYTTASGGTKITADTIVSITSDQTLYAHWTLKPVKGPVQASQMPSGAQVIEQYWSYTLRTNTESRQTSLSGYTQYGSYWVKSNTGSFLYSTEFPSGFDTNDSIYTSMQKNAGSSSETATSKTEAVNTWTGYVYWHWNYLLGAPGGAANRYISDVKTSNYSHFAAFTSSENYGHTDKKGTVDPNDYYCDRGNTTDVSWWWYRFNYYTCNYTDYYKMFQYYKLEDKTSSSDPTGGTGVSNVVKWVKYREK